MSDRNYYLEMRDGLYYSRFDRMALYDNTAHTEYIVPSIIDNDGEYAEIKNDIIVSPISILTMIEIVSKGYGLEIIKPENIKIIFDTVYGHITKCVQAKRDDVYGVYNVPDADLVKMEDFIVQIYNNNKHLLANMHDEEMNSRLTKLNFTNKFARPNGIAQTTINVDKIRRVSDENEVMNIKELLNTVGSM